MHQNSQRKSLHQISVKTSEIQENYRVLWRQGSADRMSMVKQELLEKIDTDLAAHQKICSSAARKYDSHVSCVSLAFFIQGFSWWGLLSTIISLIPGKSMVQHSALEGQACKKHEWNEECGCWLLCPQYFLCFIDFCLLYSDDSKASSKCGSRSETFSHNSARRKGKLRSTRKEYYCALPEITSTVSHILELLIYCWTKDNTARTLQYSAPSKSSAWKYFCVWKHKIGKA